MKPNTLLLVDPDRAIQRTLAVCLKRAGYSAFAEASGEAALTAARRFRPDGVLAEVALPDMPDFGLCRALREDAELADTPVLLMSARTRRETRIEAFKAGASAFVEKPLLVQEVLAQVQAILGRRDARRITGEGPAHMTGSLTHTSAMDLLRLLGEAEASGILHLARGGTYDRGVIWFHDGQITRARLGHLHGVEAIYPLFRWDDGVFDIDFKEISDRHVVRTSMHDILQEGIRRLDEAIEHEEAIDALTNSLLEDPVVELVPTTKPIPTTKAASATNAIPTRTAPPPNPTPRSRMDSTEPGEPDPLADSFFSRGDRRVDSSMREVFGGSGWRQRAGSAALVAVVAAVFVGLFYPWGQKTVPKPDAATAARPVSADPAPLTLASSLDATAPQPVGEPVEPSKNEPPRTRPNVALVEASLSRAEAALDSLRLAEAEDRFTAAATADDRSAEAHAGLAIVHYEQGRDRAAEASARRALQRNHRSARAHLVLGLIADDAGDREEARRRYRRFLEYQPEGQSAEEVRRTLSSLR